MLVYIYEFCNDSSNMYIGPTLVICLDILGNVSNLITINIGPMLYGLMG